MAGLLDLFEFALFLFAIPIAISTLVVLMLPLRKGWSIRKKASVLAVPGPLLEVLFGLFLIASAHASNCPADQVCDSVVGPIGMLLILSAFPAYLISCIFGFRIISRRAAE